MRAAFKAQRHQIGELNARIEDNLLGNRVVRAFANQAIEIEKFRRDNLKFLEIKKKNYLYMGGFQTTIRMFDGLMYMVVILAGGIFVIRGLIDPGDLVAYTMYVSTLLMTIRRIIEFAEQFQRGMTGIERFVEIMDSTVDIFDEPGAEALKDVKGSIRLDHVSFEYPDEEMAKRYESLEQKDAVILDEEETSVLVERLIADDYVAVKNNLLRHHVMKVSMHIFGYLLEQDMGEE